MIQLQVQKPIQYLGWDILEEVEREERKVFIKFEVVKFVPDSSDALGVLSIFVAAVQFVIFKGGLVHG